MSYDPIVREVRLAGKALEDKANGDVHAFFEHLRDAQEDYRHRLADPRVRHTNDQGIEPPTPEADSAES